MKRLDKASDLVKLGLAVIGLLLLSTAAYAASGALFLAPDQGIGGVIDLPWQLRLEGVIITNASGAKGIAVEVDRPWSVNLRWLPVSEAFVGVRYSPANRSQALLGVAKRFDLYPDLHMDLKLAYATPAKNPTFAGITVVQDF